MNRERDGQDADGLDMLLSAPQISTDDEGVHRDAAGTVYRAVDVDGELDFIQAGDLSALTVTAMRAWLADCTWRDITPDEIEDPDALPNEAVVAAVARHHEGGVAAFLETVRDDQVAEDVGADDGSASGFFVLVALAALSWLLAAATAASGSAASAVAFVAIGGLAFAAAVMPLRAQERAANDALAAAWDARQGERSAALREATREADAGSPEPEPEPRSDDDQEELPQAARVAVLHSAPATTVGRADVVPGQWDGLVASGRSRLRVVLPLLVAAAAVALARLGLTVGVQGVALGVGLGVALSAVTLAVEYMPISFRVAGVVVVSGLALGWLS